MASIFVILRADLKVKHVHVKIIALYSLLLCVQKYNNWQAAAKMGKCRLPDFRVRFRLRLAELSARQAVVRSEGAAALVLGAAAASPSLAPRQPPLHLRHGQLDGQRLSVVRVLSDDVAVDVRRLRQRRDRRALVSAGGRQPRRTPLAAARPRQWLFQFLLLQKCSDGNIIPIKILN